MINDINEELDRLSIETYSLIENDRSSSLSFYPHLCTKPQASLSFTLYVDKIFIDTP